MVDPHAGKRVVVCVCMYVVGRSSHAGKLDNQISPKPKPRSILACGKLVVSAPVSFTQRSIPRAVNRLKTHGQRSSPVDPRMRVNEVESLTGFRPRSIPAHAVNLYEAPVNSQRHGRSPYAGKLTIDVETTGLRRSIPHAG